MCFVAAPVAISAIGTASTAGLATGAVAAGSGIGLSSILTAGSIIGTGIQVFGQLRQARSASAEADFRSQIALNNADIAEQNAQIALEKGRADIRDERLKTRQRIGLQRAQLAGMGFSVSEGSSIDILGDTAALGELDVLRINADAEAKARNFRTQATSFQTEASLGRFAKKDLKSAGTIKATSTLITGATLAGTTFLALRP